DRGRQAAHLGRRRPGAGEPPTATGGAPGRRRRQRLRRRAHQEHRRLPRAPVGRSGGGPARTSGHEDDGAGQGARPSGDHRAGRSAGGATPRGDRCGASRIPGTHGDRCQQLLRDRHRGDRSAQSLDAGAAVLGGNARGDRGTHRAIPAGRRSRLDLHHGLVGQPGSRLADRPDVRVDRRPGRVAVRAPGARPTALARRLPAGRGATRPPGAQFRHDIAAGMGLRRSVASAQPGPPADLGRRGVGQGGLGTRSSLRREGSAASRRRPPRLRCGGQRRIGLQPWRQRLRRGDQFSRGTPARRRCGRGPHRGAPGRRRAARCGRGQGHRDGGARGTGRARVPVGAGCPRRGRRRRDARGHARGHRAGHARDQGRGRRSDPTRTRPARHNRPDTRSSTM
ncbi:MAG: L-lactate dehydrogenase, partial [uncultured Arthrobacter sp.]